MALATLESSHWQLPSQGESVASSPSAVDVLQHDDSQGVVFAEQQHSPAIPESIEPAQQQVGIERTGRSRTATFKTNAVSRRVVVPRFSIRQVYASATRKAREIAGL